MILDNKTLETVLKLSSSKELGINFQNEENVLFESGERTTNLIDGMKINQKNSFISQSNDTFFQNTNNDPFFDTTMRKSMSKTKIMQNVTESRRVKIEIVRERQRMIKRDFPTLQPQNSGIIGFNRGTQIEEFGRYTNIPAQDSERFSRERFSIDLREILNEKKMNSDLNDNKKTFFKLATQFKGVCLARCSPSMKSLVTEILNEKMGKIVLSIGDGGNDVGMIQIANVGVGILGKEGNQAALAADFNITQFRYSSSNI